MYLVIQKNQDGSFSKVTDFTSGLDNLIVVKISYQNDCNNDSEKEKQICFKFDDKHYLIDWNMDMNSITIDDIQSNLLDIKFLNFDVSDVLNSDLPDDPDLKRLILGTQPST